MITIDFRENNIVLFKVSGEFTLKEHLDAMERLEKSPQYNPDIDTIWDFSEATGDNLTMNNIYSIAENNKRIASTRKKDWKVALVVETDLNYGLARMYDAFADMVENRIAIFRSLSDAEEWIMEKEPA